MSFRELMFNPALQFDGGKGRPNTWLARLITPTVEKLLRDWKIIPDALPTLIERAPAEVPKPIVAPELVPPKPAAAD